MQNYTNIVLDANSQQHIYSFAVDLRNSLMALHANFLLKPSITVENILTVH